jgi:ACS family tartrate transporter-like MFS transporter
LASSRKLEVAADFGGAAGSYLRCAYLVCAASRPAEAGFLTAQEKVRIAADLAAEQSEKAGEIEIPTLRTLLNGRVWHLACISFAYQIGQYAIFFWMPQAIKSLSDYSNTVVGVLVMIPSMAGPIATILVSHNSDRRLERRYHAAVPLISGGIALIVLGTSHSPWLSMTLWCLATMGHSGFWGPFWSIPNDFLAGRAAAAGIALITSLGSLGGFVGPFIVGAATNGLEAIYRGLAIAGVSFFVAAGLIFMLPKKEHQASLSGAAG